MKKLKVYTADGSFYEVDYPGVIVPDPVDPDPTADELIDILLGVTTDE